MGRGFWIGLRDALRKPAGNLAKHQAQLAQQEQGIASLASLPAPFLRDAPLRGAHGDGPRGLVTLLALAVIVVKGAVDVDLVPGAGLEPAWPKPRDFKSLASTNFATRAGGWGRARGGAGVGRGKLEAEPGIEPRYTALQAAA